MKFPYKYQATNGRFIVDHQNVVVYKTRYGNVYQTHAVDMVKGGIDLFITNMNRFTLRYELTEESLDHLEIFYNTVKAHAKATIPGI